MSSFNCPTCGLPCLDGPNGYYAGCKHHPPDGKFKGWYQECVSCGAISVDVLDSNKLWNPEMKPFWLCCHCSAEGLRDV